MPDISMCPNKECPKSETCYRFKAIPDRYWQSYIKPKFDEDGCEHYWAMGLEAFDEFAEKNPPTKTDLDKRAGYLKLTTGYDTETLLIKFWAFIYRVTGWYSPWARIAEYEYVRKNLEEFAETYWEDEMDLTFKAIVDINIGLWQAKHGFHRKYRW